MQAIAAANTLAVSSECDNLQLLDLFDSRRSSAMGGKQVMDDPSKQTSLARLRMEVAGLQAVLAGRLMQDRLSLLPPSPNERRAFRADERAFFNLQARYGSALERLQSHLARERSATSSLARLRAIDGKLREIMAAPEVRAAIQFEEAFPDTTVVREEEVPPTSSGDEQTDIPPPVNTAEPPIEVESWDSYSPEDQTAARGYFEQETRYLLEKETGQIIEAVKRGRAFFRPNGDLDWDQINEVIAGVIFGAALGVGGSVGGALAAIALLVVPRMLEAIEDRIGDFLIGDIPGL
jgi:hypothetical protein